MHLVLINRYCQTPEISLASKNYYKVKNIYYTDVTFFFLSPLTTCINQGSLENRTNAYICIHIHLHIYTLVHVYTHIWIYIHAYKDIYFRDRFTLL